MLKMALSLFDVRMDLSGNPLFQIVGGKRLNMASYHLSIKSGRKGKAANHAAYIAREGKHGRSEEKLDLISKEHGNLPEWANGNPLTFWKMADAHERANGAAYREYELALPQELGKEQCQELLREFIRTEIGDKPYQLAIHCPVAAIGGVQQPHAHIMFSDRKPDGIDRGPDQHFKRHNPTNPELGGCKKDSGGKDRALLKEQVVATREAWANIQNAALEKYGHTARVDHRSNKARGIERESEKHLGQARIKKMTVEEKAYYAEARGGSVNSCPEGDTKISIRNNEADVS